MKPSILNPGVIAEASINISALRINENNPNDSDYIATNGQIVYRAEHSKKKGNWFAFSKDDAIGYANYGDKIIKYRNKKYG